MIKRIRSLRIRKTEALRKVRLHASDRQSLVPTMDDPMEMKSEIVDLVAATAALAKARRQEP